MLDSNYRVRLSSAPANVPAALILSLGPAAVPLDIIGMRGCVANIDLGLTLTSRASSADGSGAASVAVPLPDDPSLMVDLYFQYFYLDVGANRLGVSATQGLRARIR